MAVMSQLYTHCYAAVPWARRTKRIGIAGVRVRDCRHEGAMDRGSRPATPNICDSPPYGCNRGHRQSALARSDEVPAMSQYPKTLLLIAMIAASTYQKAPSPMSMMPIDGPTIRAAENPPCSSPISVPRRSSGTVAVDSDVMASASRCPARLARNVKRIHAIADAPNSTSPTMVEPTTVLAQNAADMHPRQYTRMVFPGSRFAIGPTNMAKMPLEPIKTDMYSPMSASVNLKLSRRTMGILP
mmetsp:Transcript_5569/g.14230  ORF Transcript_5569/g.14230 Transcript_5569/m.14230 type:complete len:242 (-) Transcript_5569:786-1511(-)